ncbi:MAG: MinD/ParA family protein [Planctomycetota bacterium]
MNALEKRNFGKIVPEDVLPAASRDQAEGVRRLARSRPRHARVMAITSGKGGVGKTNVAVNLALGMAQRGKNVVLVDLDLGLANADILLDLTSKYTLAQVLSGRKTIEEVMLPAMGGIRVVPGASGVERLANLSDVERETLLASFDALHRDADVIVFDTGAGISRNTTAFLAAADDIIVVTVPEPTAVVDAYAVLKMVSREGDHGNLSIVINQCAGREEAERFAGGIAVTAHKLLNVYVEKLGYIVADPRVPQAVRQRRPFLLAYPGCPASACLRAIADRLVLSAARPAAEERPSFVRRLWAAIAGR